MRQYFYSLFFIFISASLTAQMTLSEMKNILKLDLNTFETYALNNNYSFNQVDETEYASGVSYYLVNGKITRYLTFYDKWDTRGKVVTYQTNNKNEYLTFKTQIESAGFKLLKTESYYGRIVKEYQDKEYNINIHSGQSNGQDVFEITFYRFTN